MPCCLRLLAIKVAPSISPISFLLVTDRLPRRDYAFIAAAEKRFAARGTCHAAGPLLRRCRREVTEIERGRNASLWKGDMLCPHCFIFNELDWQHDGGPG